MAIKKNDIVYLLKDQKRNEELRFSLRSVEKNFPYRKVWFYGGCPAYLKPDERVWVNQNKDTKWKNTTSMIEQICRNPDITDDWWLFNDDFFIMMPWHTSKAVYDGDLYKRIVTVENRCGMQPSVYSVQLRRATIELESKGLPVLNYAVHTPMLINKEKALQTFKEFPDLVMFRSIYGNHHRLGGIDIPDGKCGFIGQTFNEDAPVLSTSDVTWIKAPVGEFIRERFREKCRFEKF